VREEEAASSATVERAWCYFGDGLDALEYEGTDTVIPS
jgi:hypothetical protein